MNLFRRHAGGREGGADAVYHVFGPADEALVDLGGRHQLLQKLRRFGLVDAAKQQVRFALLAAQHVVHAEAVQKPVFQRLNAFLENDGVAPPVAIHQRDAAAGLGQQHGFEDAENRRNAAAGRKQQVVLGLLRVQRRVEVPGRRHHVQLLAHAAGHPRPATKTGPAAPS